MLIRDSLSVVFLDVLSIFSRIAMKSKTTGSSKVKSQGSLTWLASYPKSGNTWLRSIIHAGLTGSLDINRLASTTYGFASKVAKFHKGKIVLQSPEEASKFWATCQRRMNFDLNGRKIFLKTHYQYQYLKNHNFQKKNVLGDKPLLLIKRKQLKDFLQ